MKISEVVATYIKLRDKQKELKAKYEADKKPLDEAQTLIENKLMAAYEAAGIESCKTEAGTAFLSERSSATVADRQVFMDYCFADPANIGLLEVRASKQAVDVHIQEHDGELPPGINYRSEKTINVRRS